MGAHGGNISPERRIIRWMSVKASQRYLRIEWNASAAADRKLFAPAKRYARGGADMFAPPVGITKTKSTELQRAPVVPQRHGQSVVSQVQLLQRSIGNQAMLRLLAQRATAIRSEPDVHEKANEAVRTEAHATAPLWDFSKIPIVSADCAERFQNPPSSPARRLLGQIQPKLKIGAVNDPLEDEADAVADAVMRMPDPSLFIASAPPQISRKCAACEEEDKGKLQMKSARGAEAPPIVYEVLAEPGQPLHTEARAFFEPRLGRSLAKVRVHTDEKTARSAESVQATAYTVGGNIAFGRGQYRPTSEEGMRLIAHELVHVIQQSAIGETASGAPDRAVLARQGKRGAAPRCSNDALGNCTDEDLLTAMGIGEAGNIADRDGRKGVMNVAMNRLQDGRFGGTLRAVLTKPGQFDGFKNGVDSLYYAAFADVRPIAQEVIAKPADDPTQGALYFDQSCKKPCNQFCIVYLGDGKSGAHFFARDATEDEKKDCASIREQCCADKRQKIYHFAGATSRPPASGQQPTNQPNAL
jgi:hypothetical protein